MGGRLNSINSASNLIHTDSSTLSEKVEQFWAIESYGTNKSDETMCLLPKDEKRAIDILESTTKLVSCGKRMNRIYQIIDR